MRHSLKWYIVAVLSAGMLALIFDSQTSLNGASEGIDLCIRTVIPSLFPFFLLSTQLTSVVSGLKIPILKPLRKLCKIPNGSESILLIGLLGGYPIGAQCISSAYAAGRLNRSDAQRMLAFCNNAGPAFLFGMVGRLFNSKSVTASLWLIHIASAILTGIVLPKKHSEQSIASIHRITIVRNVMQQSIQAMANVCGWVVIFRIILCLLKRWFLWLLPQEWQVLSFGILELSNGCLELFALSSDPLRYCYAAVFLSLGGLCILMQTISTVNQAGLGLGMYIPGKIIQTGFTCILAIPVANMLFPFDSTKMYSVMLISATIIAILVIFLRHKENNSSIPLFAGV